MIDLYIVSVLVFVALLVVIFYKDRKNVKRESVLLLRKTKHGRKLLIALGTRFPRIWKTIGTFAVFVCLFVSGWVFFWLLGNSAALFTTTEAEAPLALLLPSVSSEASAGPGYLAVPFWYWIISLGLLILVHEGSHGIMAARERIRIKSLGWGLFAVIPLAFVEPDEEQLRKKPAWPQLRVFAAGSFANFVLAGISLMVFVYVFSGFYTSAGVAYQAVVVGYPADNVNLTGNIIGIDNYTIETADDLGRALSTIGPNETITIHTKTPEGEKQFVLTTYAEPEPVFIPDFATHVAATLERVVPGIIDFSQSFEKPPAIDWEYVQGKIAYWEHIMDNYPALREKAINELIYWEAMLENHPRSGFIGILYVSTAQELMPEFENYAGLIDFSQGLLFFLFIINLGVGVANMMPIGPLDGGKMWEVVFKRFFPERSRSMIRFLSSATFLLLLINFIVPVLISL